MTNHQFHTGVIRPVECAKEAYDLIKSEYWLLFGIWIVGAMLGGLSFMIAAGAMTCGTFYAFLRKIDGQKVTFDDLWKGMNWFASGLVVMAFIVVPILIVYGFIYIPVVIAAAMGPRMSESELLQMMLGAFAVDLVLLVITVSLHTLLMFAFPLIVDKNLGAFAAVGLSARAVLRNLGGVCGLIGLNFVMIIAGYAAFCVGVYLVIPLIIATNLVAYRRVFPQITQPTGL